jgi:transposase
VRATTSPRISPSPTTSPSSPLPPYAPELNPIENVWEYLCGNKLAITVFDSYDDILDEACDAWTFFANDQNRIASITTRSWATVIL